MTGKMFLQKLLQSVNKRLFLQQAGVSFVIPIVLWLLTSGNQEMFGSVDVLMLLLTGPIYIFLLLAVVFFNLLCFHDGSFSLPLIQSLYMAIPACLLRIALAVTVTRIENRFQTGLSWTLTVLITIGFALMGISFIGLCHQ